MDEAPDTDWELVSILLTHETSLLLELTEKPNIELIEDLRLGIPFSESKDLLQKYMRFQKDYKERKIIRNLTRGKRQRVSRKNNQKILNSTITVISICCKDSCDSIHSAVKYRTVHYIKKYYRAVQYTITQYL